MLRSLCSSSALCCRRTWILNQPHINRHVTKAASKNLESISVVELEKSPNHRTSPIKPNSLLDNKVPSCISEESTVPCAPEVITVSKLTNYYSSLAKFRLTGLVVCSAVTGYAMAPLPTNLTTLSLCLLGTALTSASANTINQFFEVPFDSQMARTSNRVLVRGLLRYYSISH